MAIYIDPGWGGIESGTKTQPYNSWATMVTGEGAWAVGETYYQKAGTMASEDANIAANDVTIGSYTAAMDDSYAGSVRPLIAAGSGVDHAVSNFDIIGYTGVTIKDYEITGGDLRTVMLRAVPQTVSINCSLINCEVHDPAGIGPNPVVRVIGSDCVVDRCIIHDGPNDGIYNEGNNVEISNCYIYDIDDEGNGTGDYIQSGGSLPANAIWIHNCELGSGTGNQTRHGLIINPNNNTGTGGHIIEDNTIRGGKIVLSIKESSSNTIVRRNILEALPGSTNTEKMLLLDSTGVDTSDSLTGISIYNNIFDGKDVAIAHTSGTQAPMYFVSTADKLLDDVVIKNNVVKNIDSGSIEVLKSSFTYTVNNEYKNNIFVNCTGLAVLKVNSGSWAEDSNCFYGNSVTNNIINSGNANVDPVNPVLADPALDANYMPDMNSPVVGAGTTPLSNFDFYGRPHTGNGDHIGAVWPKVNTNKNRRKF